VFNIDGASMDQEGNPRVAEVANGRVQNPARSPALIPSFWQASRSF